MVFALLRLEVTIVEGHRILLARQHRADFAGVHAAALPLRLDAVAHLELGLDDGRDELLVHDEAERWQFHARSLIEQRAEPRRRVAFALGVDDDDFGDQPVPPLVVEHHDDLPVFVVQIVHDARGPIAGRVLPTELRMLQARLDAYGAAAHDVGRLGLLRELVHVREHVLLVLHRLEALDAEVVLALVAVEPPAVGAHRLIAVAAAKVLLLLEQRHVRVVVHHLAAQVVFLRGTDLGELKATAFAPVVRAFVARRPRDSDAGVVHLDDLADRALAAVVVSVVPVVGIAGDLVADLELLCLLEGVHEVREIAHVDLVAVAVAVLFVVIVEVVEVVPLPVGPLVGVGRLLLRDKHRGLQRAGRVDLADDGVDFEAAGSGQLDDDALALPEHHISVLRRDPPLDGAVDLHPLHAVRAAGLRAAAARHLRHARAEGDALQAHGLVGANLLPDVALDILAVVGAVGVVAVRLVVVVVAVVVILVVAVVVIVAVLAVAVTLARGEVPKVGFVRVQDQTPVGLVRQQAEQAVLVGLIPLDGEQIGNAELERHHVIRQNGRRHEQLE